MRIPPLIHIIWIGPHPMPDRYQQHLRSWHQHNPGWEVRLWTDATRPTLTGANEDIYQQLTVQSVRADLLRLELLARYGGLYSDADSRCLRPLAPLVDEHRLLGMCGNRGGVGPGTLAAAPAHPAITTLVVGAAYRWRRLRASPRIQRRGVSVHGVFASRFITPVLRASPDFHQVDAGRRQGTRQLICTAAEQSPATVIVHDNAGSWQLELGGRRIRL